MVKDGKDARTTTTSTPNNEPKYIQVRDGETILEAVARWHKAHRDYFRQDRGAAKAVA
jgi:hypothetical protein